MSLTRIQVDGDRLHLRHGLLRAQRIGAPTGQVRIGLVATTALLLGGDEVELEVEVGAGSTLSLVDVAATVAYHGRGRPAGWHVRLTLGTGATLDYAGEPLIVADGADVTRTLHADLGRDARLRLRETLVLGRSGQTGGRLRTHTRCRVEDDDVWLEDQDLDPEGLRFLPGLLGPHRVVDSRLRLGGPPAPPNPDVMTYALPAGAGSLRRWLGSELDRSPLHRR